MPVASRISAAGKIFGRRLLGTVGGRGGYALRQASNRLTTLVIRKRYLAGRGEGYTLAKMLGKIRPRNFGSREDTAFVALPGAAGVAAGFLAGEGRRATPIEIKKFRNGESYARIQESIRNKKMVIFQDFHDANINDILMETLLTIDAAKRASAEQVILVCPDLPYIGDAPGTPNHSIDFFKLILNLLFKAAGLDELRVGNIVLNRERSFLFLQDKTYSRLIAPHMIAWGERLALEGPGAGGLVFLAGENFRENARKTIAQINKRYGLDGKLAEVHFRAAENNRRLDCQPLADINFAGKTLYVFQTCNTGRINDDLMEALLMIYAAKKKGAKEIILIAPYLPYNRQERKAKTREAISAKFVTNALVKAAGATQVITLDLHAPATQGFFDIPMQHITARHLLARFFRIMIKTSQKGRRKAGWLVRDAVVGAPDVGRGETARRFGQEVIGPDYDFVIVDKERPEAGMSKVAAVIGSVRGQDVIIIDDMVDSGGSIIGAVKSLMNRGARRVYVATVHPVFSDVEIKLYDGRGEEIREAFEELENIRELLKRQGKNEEEHIRFAERGRAFTVNALIRLQACPYISGIVFTDSLNVPEKNMIDKDRVKLVSVADLLATVCGRIITGQSLQGYQHEGQ